MGAFPPTGTLTAEQDVVLRDRLRDHAIEVLSHQLDVERTARAEVGRGDLWGLAAVFTIGAMTWRRSRSL